MIHGVTHPLLDRTCPVKGSVTMKKDHFGKFVPDDLGSPIFGAIIYYHNRGML
jgi:hypothetical protein